MLSDGSTNHTHSDKEAATMTLHHYHIAPGSRFAARNEYQEEISVIVHAVAVFGVSDGTEDNTGNQITVKFSLYKENCPTTEKYLSLDDLTRNLAKLGATQENDVFDTVNW